MPEETAVLRRTSLDDFDILVSATLWGSFADIYIPGYKLKNCQ